MVLTKGDDFPNPETQYRSGRVIRLRAGLAASERPRLCSREAMRAADSSGQPVRSPDRGRPGHRQSGIVSPESKVPSR
jgi:hypothetical protein